MPRYAVIEGGEMRGVIDTPVEYTPEVAASRGYVECPVDVSDRSHRYVGGVFQEMPAEVRAKRAVPPTFPAVWDWDVGDWVDLRDFGQKRAAKWREIKAARSAAEFGGLTWDGSVFDSDPMSQQRIQGGVLMAQLALANSESFEIDWTLADNSVRTLGATEMMAVGRALGQHIAACHAKGRTLRNLVNAANTAAELDAIAW